VHGATNLKVGVTSNQRAKPAEKKFEQLYAELSHYLCRAYSRLFAKFRGVGAPCASHLYTPLEIAPVISY